LTETNVPHFLKDIIQNETNDQRPEVLALKGQIKLNTFGHKVKEHLTEVL
jgi:hypothetical protein